MQRRLTTLLLASLWLTFGCRQQSREAGPALHFWHTFNKHESAALQAWLHQSPKRRVIPTILPFAQANTRLRSAVEQGQCPDLVRLDASRIPGLVAQDLLLPVPNSVWEVRHWLKEAARLARFEGANYAIPQSLDGLALVRKRGHPSPWPFSSMTQMEQFADATGRRRRQEGKSYSEFGIYVDGYWFLAFLHGEGLSLPNAKGHPSIDNPRAQTALDRFANLFRKGQAMDLLDERAPSRAMARAFRQGQIGIAITGPWDLPSLADGDLDSLEVSAFPGHAAPRGGQVMAVLRCSPHPKAAWNLALALSAPALQASWASLLGSIPVTHEGLRGAGRVASEFYQALAGAKELPRNVHAAELFDDLTPAVMAVVGGDASPEEALSGVARAWLRIYSLPKRGSQ